MPVDNRVLENHHQTAVASVTAFLPGLGIVVSIATLTMAMRSLTGIQTLSPMILSIVIGMILGNIRRPASVLLPGLTFSLKRMLRLGIVLLGLQVTLPQLLSLGLPGLAVVTATLAASFASIMLAGRLLGIDRNLTGLIATGTSICGASAVMAANAVIGARQEDVAYAVACVTIFGSLSMLLFPLLMAPLHLGAVAYGLWSGATIHEVAQVVAAAFQNGEIAGHFGTIAKLARVMLLAPMVMLLALTLFRTPCKDKAGQMPFPWFVIGFLAAVLLNSLVPLPAPVNQAMSSLGTILLSCGLAAMGLQTDIRQLSARGLRPLALGAFGWLFISCFGYMLVRLSGL